MASTRNPARPVSTLADATAKTRSLVEGLQARLATPSYEADRRAPRTVDVVPVPGNDDETEEDLERQLQEYFERTMPTASRTQIAGDLHSRVIEGVVERVLADWANPQRATAVTASLRAEVIERLTQRVLEQLQKSTNARKAGTQ